MTEFKYFFDTIRKNVNKAFNEIKSAYFITF